MAWGAIIGGLLGAGGQVAGGLLGQGTGGQGQNARYDPNLDLAIQASLYSALDPLGFGQISGIPSPFEQLVGRLNSAPMASKNRNRALTALDALKGNPDLLLDPEGRNFTADQIRGFLNDPSTLPEGRKIADDLKQVAALRGTNGNRFNRAIERQGNVVPVKRISQLDSALKKIGLDRADLAKLIEDQAKFDAQMKELEDAGLGGLQTDTIINRANAAKTASELLGGAADFARSGQPGNPLSQDLFARDERQLADLQDRLGIMANFGGINPAGLFDSLTDAKLDQNLRLIEQQLGISNALQASLNPATAAAANIAGQNGSANAAQIAAQQAIAANQLRSQQAMNSSSSLANGVGSGTSSLGSLFSTLGLMSSRDLNGNTTDSSFTSGLNNNRFDTSSYDPNAGWNF